MWAGFDCGQLGPDESWLAIEQEEVANPTVLHLEDELRLILGLLTTYADHLDVHSQSSASRASRASRCGDSVA